MDENEGFSDGDIAIVGMAAHLPGADGIDAYWRNLVSGTRSIRRLTDEELRRSGEAPHMLARPDYVPFAAPLDGFADFDPDFFGLSPKDAAIMDPQHRQFLECAWETMENAGHVPSRFGGPIGVFAGCGMGSYLYFNLCSDPDLVDGTGMFLLRHTGNDKDFLATRASHVFDLRGPSINVQTACSTSLVATHLAVQSLLNHECDMALAGGVTIELPQTRGYLFREGEVLSPDGECHAFDHRAKGTVFGSGVAVVALRRMADAVAGGDHIWAVIEGTAVNNDGAAKAGYLAPSVEGQAAAIAEAQAVAGITADQVDYVECHGTGTYLGDPIEVAALTDAFRRTTDATGFARIGSVKTNIGHLDTAAGTASLIKASLALHHRQIPPSLGFEAPNPAIPFDGSPFSVADTLVDWPKTDHAPRAGVNSLGVGGTNAHAVLRAAPARAPSGDADWPFQLLTLSARNGAALDGQSANLAAHLRATDQPLADIAWTLAEGRHAFDRRRVTVAETHAQAADLLSENDPRRVFSHSALTDPSTAFMFPGGGAQYAGMARNLYETEPEFRDWMDRGLDILAPKLDCDIRALWLPEPGQEDAANARLTRPSLQLPLVMIVEYALARLWMSWGVVPDILIGHSMGENTAACLAGVMSFQDCIGLVHLRGTLFDTVPAGGMLSVALSADDLRAHLGGDLDLAAINAPRLSVATGPQDALDALAVRLSALDIDHRRIPIDIAAHSRMLDPVLDPFRDYLRSIRLSPPAMPIVSNRSGTLLSDAEATDPDYWAAHLRGTVDFEGGLATLADPDRIVIEVGPGRALSSLAGQHPAIDTNQVISTLRHPDDDIADDRYFMAMLGRVWALGGTFDWDQIWGESRRNRVPLPTYAFQRGTYFIAPKARTDAPADDWLMRSDDVGDWTWRPDWSPRYAEDPDDSLRTWLVFEDDAGLATDLAARLRDAGHTVTTVRAGDTYHRHAADRYEIAPERGADDLQTLLRDLTADGRLPDRLLHAWLVTADERHRPGSSFFDRVQEQGFWSLTNLTRAMADAGLDDAHVTVLTTDTLQTGDLPLRHPEKATVLGPVGVAPREFPGITAALLDIVLPARRRDFGALADRILEDLFAPPANAIVALRDRRLVRTVRRTTLDAPAAAPTDGTVLITGGFGGIGLTVAEALIRDRGARVALLSRTALPPRADWDTLPASHPATRRIAAVRRLEAAGGTILTLAADVANIAEMRAAKARIEAELGPITGVVHAAGTIDDAPLLSKTDASIADVLTPKVHGTRVLDTLFPDGTLDWMALFSSSSVTTTPEGQVDYVAANAFLDAFAASRSGGRTRVTAIAWGLWADAGMAADAMTARTGPPALDWSAVDAPMLDRRARDEGGNATFAATLTTDTWFIDQHRLASGEALLPGTGTLELAAEALSLQGESLPFEIADLHFLAPLHVDTPRELRVTLPRTDTGYDMTVAGIADGAEPDTTAEASLRLHDIARPAPIDPAAITARCTRAIRRADDATLTSPQEAFLRFGPGWRTLTRTTLGTGEGIAHLRRPPGHDAMTLPPGLMDLATGWAMDLIAGYAPDHLWVPVSYASVRVFAPLTTEIVSWVRNAAPNRATDDTATFDVTIATPDGTVLVDVAGFTIRRLSGALALPAPRPRVRRPLSPAEDRLRHNLSQGIHAGEGAAMFLRALSSGLPRVTITSLDLAALKTQADRPRATTTDAGFERPQLDTDFTEPEGPIETALAEIWRDLLGVAQVGAGDSFFDLGGHSLIAVRLFARIKKTWGVDFPISVLFEAPTIRACAALLAERGVAATGGAPVTPIAPSRPRFTHLVPMHRGEGGPGTPFFLVAGMFGNVLNLRHLAHLLGDGRPVFGLQARGLTGDAAPHDDLRDAATDMIAEMRQVQPHGPWMVGGFSGGGITAYEIAQQLTQAGEEVAALVMLDTPLPQRRPLSRTDRIAIKRAELREGGLLYPLRWARDRLRWEIAKRRGQRPESGATGVHDARIESAFYDAIATYGVEPWHGPLDLFRPPLRGKWQVAPDRLVSSERAYVLPDNDWTAAAPALRVHEVPGDHDSMVLEPNVRVLAAEIRRVIEKAERDMPRREAAE